MLNDKFISKGLELMKQRENESEELDLLLKKLPTIAEWFFRYYDVYSIFDNIAKKYKVEIEVKNVKFFCGVASLQWFEDLYINGYKYDNEFSEILSYEQLLVNIEIYEKNKPCTIVKENGDTIGISENINEKGLIHIGYMAVYSDFIFLGIEEHNRDEIWVNGPNFGLFKIAENIFDFFSKVNLYWSDEDLLYYTEGKYSGSDLYKNWGEDFWRVRETEK